MRVENFCVPGTEDGESGYKSGYAHVFSMSPKNGKVIDDLTLPFTGDIRCNIVKDTEGNKPTGDYYFTSKSGYFYRISVNADGTFDKDRCGGSSWRTAKAPILQ